MRPRQRQQEIAWALSERGLHEIRDFQILRPAAVLSLVLREEFDGWARDRGAFAGRRGVGIGGT